MLLQAYKKEFGETAVSPFYTFKVPSASQKDFTALIFNSIHNYYLDPRFIYEQCDIPYDFVVFNGDCIDDPDNEKSFVSFGLFMREGGRQSCTRFLP